jgi:DNA (cytosine-5)-methyltransferase 1
LEYLAAHGHDFDVIHASPPCQRYTHGNVAGNQSAKWPDLIGATRDELENSGRPYVIENVPRAPLCRPLVLCGTMFNLATLDADGTLLHLRRHRLFESNIPLAPPRPCAHVRGAQWAGAYGGARHDKHDARLVRRGGYVPDPERQARLLGAYPWRGTLHGLQESIPPAYAEWVGRQLRAAR